VRPAPEYEMKYLEICEAITLYYEALEAIASHEKEKKKAKKKGKKPPREPTPEDIFFHVSTTQKFYILFA
jgi:hypothetical protein